MTSMQLSGSIDLNLRQKHVGSGGLASELMLARPAQSEWAAEPLQQRLRLLRKVRHTLVRNLTPLEQAVTRATDRTAADTLAAEILPLVDACRLLERKATGLLRPQYLSTRGRPMTWQGRPYLTPQAGEQTS